MNIPDKPLLSTGEVAKILKKQTATVRRWADRGEIKSVILLGRYWILRSEVVRLLNGQERL